MAQVMQLRQATGWQLPNFPAQLGAQLDYSSQVAVAQAVQQAQALQQLQQLSQVAQIAQTLQAQAPQPPTPPQQQQQQQLFPGGFHPQQSAPPGQKSAIPSWNPEAKRESSAGAPGRGKGGAGTGTTKNIVYKGMVLLIEDDGYEWRKYGQKELKESIVRHYFKCKHPECQARKCLDQTLQHPIQTEVTYVGEHTCHDVEMADASS